MIRRIWEDEDLRRVVPGAILFAAGLAVEELGGIAAVYIPLYLLCYALLGFDVWKEALENIRHGHVFDENFLMALSTAGALALRDWKEAAAVMLFYAVGEAFEEAAEGKSRRSIAHLLEMKSDTACVLRDGEWTELDVKDVQAGEMVRVLPGGLIPFDARITQGDSFVDVKAITGELVPKHVRENDEVWQGSLNGEGVLEMCVLRPDSEGTASRMLALVEEARDGKAKKERFISRFAEKYTPAVTIAAVLLAFVPCLFGGVFTVWLRRALVFLVISCPCALVISVPLTFFGGIGAASRGGVLIKSGTALEQLAKADTAAFDKTGTLTRGEFGVTGVFPAPGVEKEELLEKLSAAEHFSTHPVSRAIPDSAAEEDITDYREYAGMGVSAVYRGQTVLAGNSRLMRENGIVYEAGRTGTVVYAAADGVYLGSVELGDTLRDSSVTAVGELRQLGLKKLCMLTGDSPLSANAIAKQLGLDDVKAGLMPEDKVRHMKELSKENVTVFVGDGMNDAPVLAQADVGVAMGGIGSDAAIEAADVILMKDDPALLPLAIRVARRTDRIVMENIVFALAVKAILLLLGAFGLAGMWAAVFGDVGVMVLAVLNAVRALR